MITVESMPFPINDILFEPSEIYFDHVDEPAGIRTVPPYGAAWIAELMHSQLVFLACQIEPLSKMGSPALQSVPQAVDWTQGDVGVFETIAGWSPPPPPQQVKNNRKKEAEKR